MTVGIYKITNNITGEIYIGQSKNIEKRWKDHQAKDRLFNTLIGQSMRKYGVENFSLTILEECQIEDLNEKEIFYIDKYDSYNYGLNMTLGGFLSSGNQKLTQQDVDKIKIMLKEDILSLNQIATIFNIKPGAINHINSGQSWYDPNIIYPIRPYYSQGRRNRFSRTLKQKTVEEKLIMRYKKVLTGLRNNTCFGVKALDTGKLYPSPQFAAEDRGLKYGRSIVSAIKLNKTSNHTKWSFLTTEEKEQVIQELESRINEY